jgi:hypothetical protein
MCPRGVLYSAVGTSFEVAKNSLAFSDENASGASDQVAGDTRE